MEQLFTLQNVMSLVVAIAVFATVMTIAGPLMSGDRLEARLKSVATRREELRRRSRADIKDRASGLRHVDEGFAKTIVERLDLKKLLEDPLVVDKLAQAGFRGPAALDPPGVRRLPRPFGE